MSSSIADQRIASVAQVADAIKLAIEPNRLGRVVFFIGAGCSVSAGVPGAPAIARRMTRHVAHSLCGCTPEQSDEDCYRTLVAKARLNPPSEAPSTPLPEDKEINWHNVYDQMFERHYASREATRELFSSLIDETGGAINWAHLCLGELVAKNLVSTVITTNFDQLVLAGMVQAGVIPVVCDGVESLNRIDSSPRHPQLIELHGSRHSYVLRNRPEDVDDVRKRSIAVGAIQSLIRDAKAFIVIGYEGRERGVMNLLIDAAKNFDDKKLYWVLYSNNPAHLSDNAAQFLATTRNGGLIVGQDADAFFLELCSELQLGAPTAISDPLKASQRAMEKISKSKIALDDIRREIQKANQRLATAQAALDSNDAEDDLTSKIRELRLEGKYEEAYLIAEKALAP